MTQNLKITYCWFFHKNIFNNLVIKIMFNIQFQNMTLCSSRKRSSNIHTIITNLIYSNFKNSNKKILMQMLLTIY